MKNLLDDNGYIEAVIRNIKRLPLEVSEEMISRLRGEFRPKGDDMTETMREVLEDLDRNGGLGPAVHARIRAALQSSPKSSRTMKDRAPSEDLLQNLRAARDGLKAEFASGGMWGSALVQSCYSNLAETITVLEKEKRNAD